MSERLFFKLLQVQLAGTGHKVSGMILYANTDEDIVPDNVYQMSGNQISVITLNLNQKFQIISEQLNQIVKDHFNVSV